MIIRPFILRSPDGEGGGAAAGAAPPAPAAAPAPGPKPFEGGAPAPQKTRMESLAERAGIDAPPPKPKRELPPAIPKPPEKKPDAAKPSEKPGDNPPTSPASEAPKPGEKPKVNPWKERDTYKKKAEELEARVKEYEANKLKEEDREVLNKYRQRAEELENEIRFTKYEASSEFKDKFQKPYTDRYNDALSLFNRIPVTDKATGEQRSGNEQDLFELMSLDPVSADARALEMANGSATLASRLINHAERLGDASNAMQKALADAKANGKTRETELSAKLQAQQKAVTQYTESVAKEALAEWNKDPDSKLFDEIADEEGKGLTPDQVEHNKIVQKGKELAKCLSKKHSDCKTKDELRALIRQQAAVVKRATHFGAVRRLLTKTRAELKAAQAELKQYQDTTPITGGRNAAPTNGQAKPWEGRRERLAQRAAR